NRSSWLLSVEQPSCPSKGRDQAYANRGIVPTSRHRADASASDTLHWLPAPRCAIRLLLPGTRRSERLSMRAGGEPFANIARVRSSMTSASDQGNERRRLTIITRDLCALVAGTAKAAALVATSTYVRAEDVGRRARRRDERDTSQHPGLR